MNLSELLPFILVGFAAQLVDGALGMAFGVISNTLLVSAGLPPAAASASVHMVETFTTGASAVSHSVARNVNWRMLGRLAIPGMIGGVLGATLLANMLPEIARPVVLAYLALIGLYLLWRGLRHRPVERRPKVVEPLGLAGGFLDAAGGGGWGPVVTSNLLIQGASPRETIGTVNTAEFFVTVTITVTFILSFGWQDFSRAWQDFATTVVGLLVGGLAAAPFGALFARRIPTHVLMMLVGCVLTLTSAYSIVRALMS